MIAAKLADAVSADWASVVLGELIGASLRSTVILLVALVAAFALRRASAARRHLVWTAATAMVLAVPLVSAVTPDIGLPIPPLPSMLPAPSAEEARLVPAPDGGRHEATLARSSNTAGPGVSAGRMSDRLSDTEPVGLLGRHREAIPTTLVGLWAAGVFLVLGRIVLDALRLAWVRRQTVPLADGPVPAFAQRTASRLGLDRPPVLLAGDDTAMPMTWGMLRPHVVMPAGSEAWSISRLEGVLAHEMAHVARRDCLTQFVARLACGFYWFHPLAWYAAHRMCIEREQACDDVVVLSGSVQAADYAYELAEIARSLRNHRSAVAVGLALARSDRLRDRLLSLMDHARDRQPPACRRIAVTWTLAVAVALSVGIVHPGGAAQSRVTADDSQPPAFPPPEMPSRPGHPIHLTDSIARRQPAPPGERGGADGLLEQFEALQSDHARARYMLAMIDDKGSLTPVEVDRAVGLAAREIDSDHQLALVLSAVARRGLESSVLQAFVDAAATLQSDHHHAGVLAMALESRALDRETLGALLDQVTVGIRSDHQAVRLLRRVASRYSLDEGLRRSYLRAVGTIETEHQRRAALRALAPS